MKFSKEKIREIKIFILSNVERCPDTITEFTSSHFNISPNTSIKYVNELIQDNKLKRKSRGNKPNYEIISEVTEWTFENLKTLNEDRILVRNISPLLTNLKANINASFDYATTEMINNVIDHSSAEHMKISVLRNDAYTKIIISDDGIGIFNKIQKDLDLDTPENSIVELAKGKYTSDSTHHTGEGIFFTSKICDDFAIISENLKYTGDKIGESVTEGIEYRKGTTVVLKIYNNSDTSPSKIFDEYSDLDKEPSFFRTKIPLKLMEIGNVILVSRSQAKRLVTRFEKFKEVILDFSEVSEIGQGFADELFRVFHNAYPEVKLVAINCCENVQKMIRHVEGIK